MLDKHDKLLIGSVRDGVLRMPPWGDVLSDANIADAIAYARTLHRRARRELRDI